MASSLKDLKYHELHLYAMKSNFYAHDLSST